ncbi:MAG: tetratricopeptide repeat protein [Armatimonadota bacterium]
MVMKRSAFTGLPEAVCLCLLVLTGMSAAAASLDEAKQAIASGDAAGAAAMLSEIVEASPDQLAAQFWLGRARLELGDLRGAVSAFENVLAEKPESVESRYWLAEVLLRQRRYAEARSHLQKVLEQDPAHTQAQSALAGVQEELDRQESLLGGMQSDWVFPADNRMVALETAGLKVEPGEVDIYSDHVYDYTFSDPPTDWLTAGGLWEATSRWTCSPQWSWFGGFQQHGLAALWNKRQFTGDITVEVHAAFKMGVHPAARSYRNPNDMNVTIFGDGINPSSGYSFIYGGELNSASRIMKGTEVLAENRAPEALLPIFEDGYPSTYEFHRKWWMLRARKAGDTLTFWVDDVKVAEVTDPDPLETGRVAIWARDNGLILSRIKIYYEGEQIPRDPIPMGHLAVRPETQVHARQATISSSTHPARATDFETDLAGVSTRDGDQGAMVTLAAPGSDGTGRCAKLVNTYAGGTFAANLREGRFDLHEFPRLAFDYRLDPQAKVNLHLTVDGEPCEITFSGLETPAGGRTLLGRVSGVRADGQWHHVEFDLLGHAERAFGPDAKLVASDLFIGNMSSEGYLDAGFGGNHAGTTICLDNLALLKPGGGDVEVAAKAASGVSVDGWAISFDQDPTGRPGAEVTSEDGTASFSAEEDGVWYVHAMPRLAEDEWGEVEHLPIRRDTTPPRIVSVEPGGDVLGDGGPVRIHLSDGDGIGVDPASVKLQVGERELTIEDTAVSFDPASETLSVDVARLGETFPSGGTLQVTLLELADRNQNAVREESWAFEVGPEVDKASPPAPQIVVGDVPVIANDFEDGMGEWSNWGAEGGAVLSLDPTTAASGEQSLKLYNPTNGGSFGAYVRKTAFDAGRYRVVRFAYKIPERLRADLMVHVNGSRKSIRFTDTDSSYERIGEIEDVRADNQWHTAEFNLYEMLRRDDPHAPGYRVLQMWIADSGWTSNAPGQSYHIDDFELIPIVSAAEPLRLAWNVLDLTGLAGVNWTITDSPVTELPEKLATTDAHVEYAEGGEVDGWLHVRAQNSAGAWSETAHRRLLVDSTRPTAAQLSPAADATTATSIVELELEDDGIAGVDPASIVLDVGGTDYKVSNTGLTYRSDQGRLVWNCEETAPSPVVFEDGAVVDVALKSASDYAGNPVTGLPTWTWTMDYAQDKRPPQIAEIDCSTHRSHIAHTFEDGVEGWGNRGGGEGASVEHDTSTAASGEGSVKLTQQQDGGHMQALLTSDGFDAERFPVIAFDYRFDPGVKLDLLVHMNGQWRAIAMTDDPNGSIGRVPGMRADGKWHHASVNIAPMLRRHQRRGPMDVTAVIVGDRNSLDNKKGATAHFDNFVIGSVGTVKPVFRWKATDTTGISGYSYVLDQEPTTQPPLETMGDSGAKSFEDLKSGLWFFHVRAVDGAGNWGPTSHYAIMHSAG